MSDSCASPGENLPPRRCTCPVNGGEFAQVSPETMRHHIKNPSGWAEKKQGYYFCEDPDCDVVYFGEDGSIISKSEVRSTIGIKDSSDRAPVCYCFGISRRAATSNPLLKDYVVQKTRLGLCSCDTSNPSGRCCLKDFP